MESRDRQFAADMGGTNIGAGTRDRVERGIRHAVTHGVDKFTYCGIPTEYLDGLAVTQIRSVGIVIEPKHHFVDREPACDRCTILGVQ